MKFLEATPDQCCCNCAHCIREENSHCAVDGHLIGYVATFVCRCEYWKEDKWQSEARQTTGTDKDPDFLERMLYDE